MTPQRRLEVVLDFQASEAWSLIREVMQAEILAAALQIAENRQLSPEDIHFRRGAIWAAKRLLDMPKALQSRFETEVLRDDADRARAAKTTQPR